MAGGSSSCASMTNRTASAFANTDLSFEGCSSGCICVCVCVLWKERAHTCTHVCVFASAEEIVELAPKSDEEKTDGRNKQGIQSESQVHTDRPAYSLGNQRL